MKARDLLFAAAGAAIAAVCYVAPGWIEHFERLCAERVVVRSDCSCACPLCDTSCRGGGLIIRGTGGPTGLFIGGSGSGITPTATPRYSCDESGCTRW